MANLFDPDGRQRQIVIRIPRFEIGEHFTVYSIEIGLGQFKWSVNRRFSEFATLHDELVAQHKLRDLELPAKRMFNNQSVTFVQRRQKELEEYLRRLFKTYPRPPPSLSRFTLWDKYEIHGITATMSAYVLGMSNAQSNAEGGGSGSGSGSGASWKQPFEFSVLQVHAINARVLSPAPTNDLTHMKFDIGHIMNFATHLPAVRIWGNSGHFGTSSIVMNQLPYDLSIFKEIESLQLINVDLTRLKGLDQLKETLTKLSVHQTLQTLKELLLQDLIDCDLGQDSTMVQCWSRIVEADFSNNSLRTIDESVKLLPNVQKLNLAGNQIPAITNLEHLSELQRLNLSKNGITDLINLNVRLGNIKELILVENRLTSLLGLSRVYSLQSLDVSKNQISELIEVCHIGRLPCLEHLRLTDNPVTLVPDYRTKVFEQFGERAPEVKLDGRNGTQKELDTAAVLQALQRAKERPGPRRSEASTAVTLPAEGRAQQNVARSASPHSLPRPAAVRPSSLVPDRVPPGSAGETLDREKMESLRSRGGKRWLVEYNQMLDQHQRQQQQQQQQVAVAAGGEAGGRAQGVRQLTIGQQPQSAASAPEVVEGNGETSASASASASGSVEFEARLEQSLARLLMLPSPPELVAYAPALPLLPEAGEEGGVPRGGAVAITASGRLLVLLRLPEGDELSLALNLEAANLAQLVRGFRGLYLRLEERFAGPDGVAVLLTMRAAATDRLAELLSRHSGLAVVSLEARRRRQLEDYVGQREGAAQLVFYSIALFRGPGLRYLVSVAVSRRRLHLLDERLAALPPPLGASGDTDLSFAPLGSYSRRDLELPAAEEEAETVADADDDTSFFLWPLRVRLRPRSDRAGALDELRIDFDSAADRQAFQEALAALEEEEEREEEAAAEEEEEETAARPAEQRQLDFERWDALSAAVKHRVAQSPNSGCPMRRLIDMDSAGLARFFARHVRPQLEPQQEGEEQLVAVMWAYWLHYRSRAPEALACVFLTSRAIYVTFDSPGSPTEESLALKSLSQRRSVSEEDAWSVSVFSFRLNCLVCAYVGPFNQYLRFSGENADQDFTLITRDFRLTENLLGYLRRVFRGGPATPASAASSLSSDGEAAVYRSARPSSSEQLREGVEIRFPNDEILSELQFVVEEAVQPGRSSPGLSSSPHGAVLDSSPSLLYYLLLENLSIDLVDYVRCCTANHLMSVLLLAGSGHLVLLRQNVSQFPIPDFARGPPDLAQFAVLEVRPLACLTHLTLSSCDRRLLTLSFAPLPAAGSTPSKAPPGPNSPGLEAPRRPFAEAAAAAVAIGDPVHVTAYIQNARDVDKLVKLVRATWKEHTGASFELPLHRS